MERQLTAADSLGGLTVATDANGRWGFARIPSGIYRAQARSAWSAI